MSNHHRLITRRRFVHSLAGTAASFAAPAVVTASKTERLLEVGSGNHRYAVIHDWPKLPSRFTWQTTHDVAVDRDGCVYVIHEGRPDQPDHPSIFVFDPTGKYVRSFGQQFQGGAHGLEVRDEGSERFLYVCGYQPKTFAKLTTDGEVVWQRYAPMESHLYAQGEDLASLTRGNRDNFMPTNFAFLPDGDFLLADGYGSFYVHRYDRHATWRSCFGGPGNRNGQFNTPHGICLDSRPGRDPQIIVADRTHGRLQWFSLSGEHRQTLSGFILPANIDFYGDILLVPDMASRITLLDRDNRIISHLGDDAAWRKEVAKGEIRAQPQRWEPGKFVHPHDACFDANGNIYVAEFVTTGRITKLERLA